MYANRMKDATVNTPILRHLDKNGLKKRKSVPLTSKERGQLDGYVKMFGTKTEAAEHAGIERVYLLNLLKKGSTSEATFLKVKKTLKKYFPDND